MIKRLINLANHLDSRGLTKEADYLDDIINDPDTIEELGDFRDLDSSNIKPEEALEVGFMLGKKASVISKTAIDGVSRMQIDGGGGPPSEAEKKRYQEQEYYLSENERFSKNPVFKQRYMFDQDTQKWKLQTLTDLQILDEKSQRRRRKRRYGKENPTLEEMIIKDLENAPEAAKAIKDSGSKKVSDFAKWLKRTGSTAGGKLNGYLVTLNPKYLMNALDDYKLGIKPGSNTEGQEFA